MPELSMKDLQGRVAVITGAGSGFGRAMALCLAREGVDIVVADIEEEAGRKVQQEIEAIGRRALSVRTDVADAASVTSLAEQAFGSFGKVDILINNAGVAPVPLRAAWDFSLDDIRWVINVNLMGVIHGVAAFVPRMRTQPGQKHLINTSSVATLIKSPGLSTYVASKMGVTGFTDTIREELAPYDFGVTLLMPGFANTRIMESDRNRPESERKRLQSLPVYSDYAQDAHCNELIAGSVAYEDAEEVSNPVEPEVVGPLVVRAIRENLPYCMTHPAPIKAIRKYADALSHATLPIAQG
jgi:NAD(P)-dependent dehydrogenase (short-subunit alcohol dehydrogenase family)